MVENINTEMALSEGYLTLAHSRPLLEALARRAPQVVLTSDDAVVGFSLTATPSLRDADLSDAPAAALDDAPKCGNPECWSCPDHQSCAALDGCAYFGSRAADVLSPWSRRPR